MVAEEVGKKNPPSECSEKHQEGGHLSIKLLPCHKGGQGNHLAQAIGRTLQERRQCRRETEEDPRSVRDGYGPVTLGLLQQGIE